MEQSATNTAEMVRATTPMEFFSMVHHIESCIGAKTLEIPKSRNWEGPLTEQDWKFAEELVLDPAEVSSTVRNDGMLVRVPVGGYRAEDIRLHTERSLLGLCGYTENADGGAKMFYARVKLPQTVRGSRSAAWISDGVLHVALPCEQAATVPPDVQMPLLPKPVRPTYAAAM
ncbi:Hsp20/alpha crystallin family protein [Terriglobus roseus]|nr:Hsp20/alpha crystallin family protein [Terriglobus roseus]